MNRILFVFICSIFLTCNPGKDEFPIFCDEGYILDDGSCCYEAGCMNFFADNYNPNACIDDSSCYINGCLDEDAANYNPNATIDNDSCVFFSVFAGVYDENYSYTYLSNPIEIEVSWYDDNLYFQGETFLDIDMDGNEDLKFKIGGYNQDSIHIPYPLEFNNCLLTPFNGFEIAFDIEPFYVGLGQSMDIDVVRQLSSNDGIDVHNNWYSDSDGWIRMFYENYHITMPFGSWYYSSGINYIAVRKNDKHGWIQVDMSDGLFPKIQAHAFQY